MIHPILVMTRLTFREAVRRRIVLAALLLGLAFLAIYNLGFYFVNADLVKNSPVTAITRREVYNFLLMAGLYAVAFLAAAMAALMSADTLAGEIGSGTIQTLAAKPMRRLDIVLGKWLGFAGLLALYVGAMGGGLILSVWLQVSYVPPNPTLGVALIFLEGVLVMSLTLMCSSRMPALATGGVVFGLYGLAFIGGWVEQIGSFLGNQTAVNVGILSSLIMPSEAVWKRAAFEMQSPLVAAIGFSPFSARSVPSPLMVAYAMLYSLVGLSLACWWFSHRDL